MPRLNYYYWTDVEITKDSLTATPLTSSITSNLDLGKDNRTWNKEQLKALTLILCNLVMHHYLDNGIFLYSRKKLTVDKQFNPNEIGYSSLFTVLDKLDRARILNDIPAPPRATGYNPKMLSEFHATKEVLHLAISLNIFPKTVYLLDSPHVSLRDRSKKDITYKSNVYTKHIEELMRRYCKHLNKQNIAQMTDNNPDNIIDFGSWYGGIKIHLHRRYKNWTDVDKLLPDINKLNSKMSNPNFNLGGRSGGLWMSGLAGKKDNRKTIHINGEETAIADFPCSHLNLCYKHETGSWYQQETYQELKAEGREYEDGYMVSTKLDRDLVKKMIQLMFNVKGRASVSRVFNKWLYEEGNGEHRINKMNSGYETIEIQEEIVKHHYKIKDYFYKGKIAGQVIQFEEANLMFHIADQFITGHDITTLTVHDELIVLKEHHAMVKDFMYTSGHCEVCNKYSLMSKIKDL